MKSLKVPLNLSQTRCGQHGVGILVFFTVLLIFPLAAAAQAAWFREFSQGGGEDGRSARREFLGFESHSENRKLRSFRAAHRGSNDKKPRGPPVLSSSL